MPAVARELQITYGSYTVGGTTDKLIDGYTQDEREFTRASVQFSFIVTGTTEALFAGECAAAEAAFRIPRLALAVTQGAATLLSLSHTANTGFNAEPRIEKREDLADTGRSRRYTVRIEFGAPADNSGTSGRRSSQVNVLYMPSRRRRVTISGVYTALSGNAARAQYEASINAYATSVLSALGGIYELAEEPVTDHDDQNKVINFSQVYDEIIFSQAGATDDTAIVRQVLQIARRKEAPGDTPTTRRLVTLEVNYDTWIDKNITQALVAKWDSIRPWIVQQAATVFAGTAAVTDERVQFDFTDNRISATMTIIVASGNQALENRITTELYDVFGVVLVPAWTGDSFSKYDYQGPASRQQTITQSIKVVGTVAPEDINGLIGSSAGDAPPQPAPGDDSLVRARMSLRRSTTPIRMGMEGAFLDVTEAQVVVVFEYYKRLAGGATPTP